MLPFLHPLKVVWVLTQSLGGVWVYRVCVSHTVWIPLGPRCPWLPFGCPMYVFPYRLGAVWVVPCMFSHMCTVWVPFGCPVYVFPHRLGAVWVSFGCPVCVFPHRLGAVWVSLGVPCMFFLSFSTPFGCTPLGHYNIIRRGGWGLPPPSCPPPSSPPPPPPASPRKQHCTGHPCP